MMMASAARPARGGDVLAEWAQSLTGQTAGRSRGRLRFAFYGRVPTEDWQDPVTQPFLSFCRKSDRRICSSTGGTSCGQAAQDSGPGSAGAILEFPGSV
jgi:hypothetical protein